MKHLTEEEWLDYYYGESADREAMQPHIAQCAECAARGQELTHDLGIMRESAGEPQRDAAYGEEVWESLRSSLTPYPKAQTVRRWNWTAWLNPRMALAGAALALLAIAAAAFYSGRMWEQKRGQPVTSATNQQARQRIILFVVSDHLDRSQRLLAELNDPEQAAADHGLQAKARELLTANRLYRQSSRLDPKGLNQGSAGEENASLETILDDLEPVLIELANQPDHLDSTKIVQLRKQLNTGGLLFEIHVLRSRAHPQEPNAAPREGTI
jgi:hypothetical protein